MTKELYGSDHGDTQLAAKTLATIKESRGSAYASMRCHEGIPDPAPEDSTDSGG